MKESPKNPMIYDRIGLATPLGLQRLILSALRRIDLDDKKPAMRPPM
jgi:hypothetical protein